jgi:CRP-like cAMP-binding protein
VLLHPGEFFGEMSLLDGGPRSATVVADTPVRLLVISRRHFSVLLKDVPGLTETLLVTLSRRVRQAEERAERLGQGATGGQNAPGPSGDRSDMTSRPRGPS